MKYIHVAENKRFLYTNDRTGGEDHCPIDVALVQVAQETDTPTHHAV
jgi:hypothetical protein